MMMRTHVRQVGWWIGIAAMTVPGCTNPTPDALKDVASAERDYRSQNYIGAETKLNRFIKSYPESPESAEAYYLRSLCGTRRSNRVMAEADARQCIKLAKSPGLAAGAHATIASILLESNRTEEALQHFEAAVKSMPEKPPTDVVRFRYATCLQREGRWADAREQFSRVCQKYPSSEIAPHARRMMEWSHDGFSIQCGSFRDRKAAAALEGKLKLAGQKAWVESRSRSGEVLYSVYVGEFARYASARDALPRVQRSAGGAYIVP